MKSKLLGLLMLICMGTQAQTYVPDHNKNLTVVYYIPSDMVGEPNYEDRLSKLLLYGQNWFSNQMHINGYDDVNGVGKTYGLLKDAALQRVKIITLNSVNSKATLMASDQISVISAEVNAYFTSHQTDKLGTHVMIMVPTFGYDASGQPSGGQPYNGIGKYCILTDSKWVDTQYLGNSSSTIRRWIGGFFHELGHALNLPHDHAKKSEVDDPNKGTSLMAAGNYSFGASPTYLTATDCAILNTNECFNNDNNVYYGSVVSGIKSLHGIYNTNTQSIEVSGKYFNQSLFPVTSVLYYNDPNVDNEGVGTNNDYNAITWESKPIGTDSFFVSIPVSDIYVEGKNSPFQYPFELKTKLVHSNGTVVETINYFSFTEDGIPILPYSMPINNSPVARTGWTVIAGSKTINSTTIVDQNKSTPAGAIMATQESAEALIDNDYSTYWHSKYDGLPSGTTNPFPHQITIDTKSVQNFVGWSCNQRRGLSRSVKNLDIYGGDDNGNYVLIKTYVLNNVNGVQFFEFDNYKSFRYFRIIAQDAYDGQTFAALSDVVLYKGPDPALISAAPTPTLVSNTGWTVKAGTKTKADNTTFEDENNNTESGNERAENILNNNAGSYWVSKYTGLTTAEQDFNLRCTPLFGQELC